MPGPPSWDRGPKTGRHVFGRQRGVEVRGMDPIASLCHFLAV